ncbi:MAG TPA: transcription-repair coupling factor, partial [Dehalococcoidia bacterium]|nr:transcription-repair coupling factor [Dehalococcoidia bacterium]
GALDIVIGTHRLLQQDVSFKNLGLAVVDEEQRFGVAHKERLKQLRKEVDVLTLSATPIPRTLNQALSGIRDLSTMDTPPEARLPVKTFVSEYSEDLIKEAILREMERGGQIFFLHNRVKTIEQVAADLRELVPQARIMIGHGQMPEMDLEDVMVAFSAGEADILVCTTIIESGLDLPNVNTLILDRADRFGLSQLYQLRGRIGRGEHRAYAYMLVPRGRRITEAAERRLQAILEASELGSGFRIAMRDLEIRGAGNLLGSSQSGHIREVGLDLYSQLLKEAVSELQREQSEEVPSEDAFMPDLPRMELPLTAHIPDSYIPHMPSRLAIYQRVARLKDRNEMPALRQELRDRFGPTPEEVENLLTLADFRASARGLGIDSILQSGEGFVLHLKVPVGGAKIALQRALGPSVNVGNQQINLPARTMGDQWLSRLTRVVGRFRAFQDRLQSLAG